MFMMKRWFRPAGYVDNYSQRLEHKIVHDEEMVQTCRTCGKLFAETRTLTRHKISHDEEMVKTCMKYGKLFAETGTLTRHMIVHDE